MSKKDEILALVAEGKSTPEIAKLVGVSVNTVRYHREPSKKKVGLREMVKFLYDRSKAEDQLGCSPCPKGVGKQGVRCGDASRPHPTG